jgi:cell division septum initiation protein DivIVA
VSPDDNLDCHLASNSSDTVHVSFVQVAMNSGDNQGPDRDVRERFVNLMQSIGKGPKKQIPAEELQKLKSAASRLDQMLKAAANADQQALKSATAKLDQLLSDIRAGKDVTSNLKRRENSGT